MTNGNGGQPTPASGFPVNGAGSSLGGPTAVGQGHGAQGSSSFGGVPVPANVPGPAQSTPSPQPRTGAAEAAPPRKGSPLSISNWRVRWRLIAIITVPTVTALILRVIQIVRGGDKHSAD